MTSSNTRWVHKISPLSVKQVTLYYCLSSVKCWPFRLHRSTTYVDAVYCYRWSSVICVYVPIVSPANTAEPMEMPFGLWTLVGPRKHILHGSPALPMGRGQFWGGTRRSIVKYREYHPCAIKCDQTSHHILKYEYTPYKIPGSFSFLTHHGTG